MRELDIYIEGASRPIGILTGDDDLSLSFRYTAEAINNRKQISLSLPLTEQPYGDVDARGFFENLLQENASLEIIMAKYGISQKDVAGLLYHMGRDCPGAISCVPAGQAPGKMPGHLDKDYDPVSDAYLVEVLTSLRDRRRLPAATKNPSPLAGVQGKIAVTRLADGRFGLPKPGSGAPTTHILKIPCAGDEALVDYEQTLMDTATHALGEGRVARTEILTIGDIRCLMISRFDRRIETGVVHRVHQEDFCQALGLPSFLKYERDGTPERAFNAARIGGVLAQTEAPISARSDFLDMTHVNLILGNTDNHAKNHAVLYPDGGPPRLAPLYDVTPILLDAQVTHDFSFRIGAATALEHLSFEDISDFSAEIGFHRGRSRRPERSLKKRIGETMNAIATRIDGMQGPRRKIIGDMIAHQLDYLNTACDLDIAVPERDAFIRHIDVYHPQN